MAAVAGPKAYLIVASIPTPNGRLHLGHIAGPYLRADVLARHYRSRGHTVMFGSGLDSYESYVLARARADSLTPGEVARRFGTLIQSDLAALDVEPDVWIDPLDPTWHAAYHQVHQSLMNELVAVGAVRVHRAPLLYDSAEDRFVTGCWLTGQCPACGVATGGSSCEVCGTHFPPYRIVEPCDKLGRDVRAVEVDHLLLAIDSAPLQTYLAAVAVAEPYRLRAVAALTRGDFHARLVTPGRWGVPWPRLAATSDSVLFTYAFNLAWSRLFGEAFRRRTGATQHPFDRGSTVCLITTIGVDVLMPRLLTLPAMAHHVNQRGYDRIVVNEFYTLASQKFSTSRGHAIWAADVMSRTGASPDGVRFYLAATAPDVTSRDFVPADFVGVQNRLATLLTPRLAAPLPSLRSAMPATIRQQLRTLFAAQDDVIEAEPLKLPDYVQTLQMYLDHDASTGDAYWWLRGWAVLSSAIMPRCARTIWHRLGLTGEPRVAYLETDPSPDASPAFGNLTMDDLKRCMPPTITT